MENITGREADIASHMMKINIITAIKDTVDPKEETMFQVV
jgi:hypothetical protein